MSQPVLRNTPEPDQVLTRALLDGAERLEIAQKKLAKILGVSAASVSRLGRERTIDPASKEGELALLFLRMYRSLDAIVGGKDLAAQRWLRANNHHLNGVPATMIETVTGLANVAEYLDAMRGRL